MSENEMDICEHCDGRGWVWNVDAGFQCKKCNGTGRVAKIVDAPVLVALAPADPFDQSPLVAEDAARIAELEQALAAKDATIAALREALTPFANAAEDEVVCGRGDNAALYISYKGRFEVIAIKADQSEWLEASHLRAARRDLKDDTP